MLIFSEGNGMGRQCSESSGPQDWDFRSAAPQSSLPEVKLGLFIRVAVRFRKPNRRSSSAPGVRGRGAPGRGGAWPRCGSRRSPRS